MATLYLVATPIGNLEDISARALRVLREAPVLVAEDTRVARKLLSHFGIPARRLLSYTEHSPQSRVQQVVHALAGGDVAFLSDAGTPVVSDPGLALVQAAVDAGHRVEAIPGASAVTMAVAVSGLEARSFTFLGFLPRKASARAEALKGASGDVVVLFEAPSRLHDTLVSIREAYGDARLTVCRELTKLHEEVFRGTVSEALDHFTEPRGEITVVVERPANERAAMDSESLLADLKAAGLQASAAAEIVARHTDMPRREAYRKWHRESPES